MTQKINLRKLAWWNRQPTLWSHSCPAMELIPRDDEEDVIGVPPLSIEPLNMDFDGDTSAIYVNHDEEALRQMFEKASIQNTVFYDAKDDFLSTIRHEALYAAYVLSRFPKPETNFLAVGNLKELPEEVKLFNNNLHSGISIDGELYTYGICLLNKWCGFEKIHIDELITKKQVQMISRKIYEIHGEDSQVFYDHLSELEKKLMFFITITNHVPTLSLEEMINLVDDDTHKLIRKIPRDNPYISYHINNGLTDRCIDNFDHDSNLYQLFKSGSRFSKTQLARSCISIGLLADQNNVVDPNPIRSNLIEGLTPSEFFQSSPGTRKGKN